MTTVLDVFLSPILTMRHIFPLLLQAINLWACVETNTIIQWGICTDTYNNTLPVDCGTLLVPLDYTVKSNQTYTLDLLRIPAPVQPANGSIVLNFGGPGETARSMLLVVLGHSFKREVRSVVWHAKRCVLTNMIELNRLSARQYNLITFDPRCILMRDWLPFDSQCSLTCWTKCRGTATSNMPLACYDSEYQLQSWMDAQTLPDVNDEKVLGRLWARATIDAKPVHLRTMSQARWLALLSWPGTSSVL